MQVVETIKDWLWRVFTDHPGERTDSDGEAYVRLTPRSRFLGLINLRPVYYVKKRDREANAGILPAGYNPSLAYQLYQKDGVEAVERYVERLRRPRDTGPTATADHATC